MKLLEDVKLGFDDVMIVPQLSGAASRKDIKLDRTFKFPHASFELTCVPIIAANMDTTGSIQMAQELMKHGMLTALHKFYDVKEVYNFFHYTDPKTKRQAKDYAFYTMGISTKDFDKLIEYKSMATKYPKLICLDVANGYMERFSNRLKEIRTIVGNESVIMAGNVVTGNLVERLIDCGADIVKVGIGPGSVCTTRIQAGVGYPQFSAINECAYYSHGHPSGHICGDGGCRYPGDIAKAFAAGADFVMIGGMLAGTDECEGEWVTSKDSSYELQREPKLYLKFHGMSSEEAMDKHYNGMASHRTSEGIEVKIPYKGLVSAVVQDILGGLSSACSYSGAVALKYLHKCAMIAKVNKIKNDIFDDFERKQ